VPGRTAAVISFRLGGTDGVAIEAAKWCWALESIGFSVSTVAGEGPVDRVVDGLGMYSEDAPDPSDVREALEGADLVVVENLCSLPLNPAASAVVADVLRGRPALMHHHDLPWQRDATLHMPPPPDDPAWTHVTVNELSRTQLAERGIPAVCIRNRFDVDEPPGDREKTRAHLDLDSDRLLVVQPTRAIPRKNVPGGIALARAIGADFWLLGAAEDGYAPELDRILRHAGVRVIRGVPEGGRLTMRDVYAASDLVVMPSFWEGFGNPAVESAVHRRPLSIGRYPVAAELAAYGFDWFRLDDPDRVSRWLEEPDRALIDHNALVAREHFSLAQLPAELEALLDSPRSRLGI
jgi:mannosylglucosylglycerate synthase